MSGINAFVSELSTLLASYADTEEIKYLTIINGLILVTSVFLIGRVSDRFGRRTLILWGSSFCVFFLLLAGIFLNISNEIVQQISFFLISCVLCCFAFSLGPVFWVYLPEILHEEGVALALIANEIIVTLVFFLTPFGVLYLGTSSIMFFYAGVLFLGLLYLKAYMVETKGRTQEEINRDFMKQKAGWTRFEYITDQ